MRKILIVLLILIGIILPVNAVEIEVVGQGSVPITGYNVKAVRNMQDAKMTKKAENSNFEILQNQQIKESIRQAETRKKQDANLKKSVRESIIVEANQKALENGIKNLIDLTFGANASKNQQVLEKFSQIVTQSSSYIVDKTSTSEINNNNEYVVTLKMLINQNEFKSKMSNLGVAINTQNVRAHSILIVLDEFFVSPSDLHESTATKEVITYSKSKNEKNTDKEAFKTASSSQSAYSGLYGKAGATAKSGTTYGKFNDYTNNEKEFFQYIKEYTPKTPKVSQNNTLPALQSTFTENDIRALDNAVFKSKYFGGMPITSEKLENSATLAGYVSAARRDAKADFFAIGVATIVDNGKNTNTGKNVADGNVYIRVYSTVDSEVIASGTISETSFGNSADQARSSVAKKMGEELGNQLSIKIMEYWNRRQMYGREYVVRISGNFSPVDQVLLDEALNATNGVKSATLRTATDTFMEYTITYSGNTPAGLTIFKQLYRSDSTRFGKYKFKLDGNQIKFYQGQ